MYVLKFFGAAAFAALVAMPASALVVQSQSGIMTKNGQRFDFAFTGLPASNGTGGMVTISSGPATKGGPADAGFDLDGVGVGKKNELFHVGAEGSLLGRYTCSGPKGQVIPGFTMNGKADCVFSLVIDLGAAQLDNLLLDGIVNLAVSFGRGVGHFGDGDQLNVSLSYEEMAPVPLPATGILLAGGLAGLGFAARRRRGKANA